MNFEDTLRIQMKELPVPKPTRAQQQFVFDQIHHKRPPKHRTGRVGSIAAVVVACVFAALLCVGVIRDQMQPRFTLSSWVTAPVTATVLDTPNLRSAVKVYIRNNPSVVSGSSASSSTTKPSAGHDNTTSTTDGSRHVAANDVTNLAVRWSQIHGRFGYAVVSYRFHGVAHIAGVSAQKAGTSSWQITALDQSPALSQTLLAKYRVYLGERGAGRGLGVPSAPAYDMAYGIVVDPDIVSVLVTWRDGTQTQDDVVNGVFGAMRTYSPSQQIYIAKIQGVTAEGKVVSIR